MAADVIGLIDIAVNWGKEIKAAVDAAKHNKDACRDIGERVALLAELVESQKKKPERELERLKASVLRVSEDLEKAKDFLKMYNSASWLRRHAFAKDYKDGFSAVGEALSISRSDFAAVVDSLVLEKVSDLTAANTAVQKKFDAVLARVRSHKESADIRTLEFCERPGLPESATALKPRVDAIKKMVFEPGSNPTALVGMGGVGKTTLAAALCAAVADDFDHIVWINVGQRLEESDILARLQQLWKEVMKSDPPHKSIKSMRNALLKELESKKALIVFDNVWKCDDIKTLLVVGDQGKVLFTTRDSTIARRVHAREYKVKEMKEGQALELFCRCAFQRPSIPDDKEVYRHCVQGMVAECGGLPLALNVVGSLAAGYLVLEEWQEGLTKLRKSIGMCTEYNKKVLALLRMSFDCLEDDEQDLFLCLAGNPEGYHVSVSDLVEQWVLRKYDMDREEVDSDEEADIDENLTLGYKLYMHLVHRSLVIHDPSGIVGLQGETDEALMLSMMGFQETEVRTASCHLHDLIREMALMVTSEGDITNRQRLFSWTSKSLQATTAMVVELSTCSTSATGLLPGDVHLPKLRSSVSRASRLQALPEAILLSELRVLDASFANLQSLPRGLSRLQGLQLLRLDGNMIETLPQEIGHLKHLVVLSLRLCKMLTALPSEIGELGNLHGLHVGGCALQHLPDSVGNLHSLKKLDLSFCSDLKELPITLESASELECLNVNGCGQLASLPLRLGSLLKLRVILAVGCTMLTEMPKKWPVSLEVLDLQGCENVKEIPDATDLQQLRILHLYGCFGLESFPSSGMPSLQSLGLPLVDIFELESKIELEEVAKQRKTRLDLEDGVYYLVKGKFTPSFHRWLQGTSMLKLRPQGVQYSYIKMKDAWTPLTRAAYKGQTSIVESLLEKGADGNAPDKDGWTPLTRAVDNGQRSVVTLLLDKGFSGDVSDELGWSPLTRAAARGHKEMVQLLIEHGAEATMVDKSGRTPLGRAAATGQASVVEFLLDSGVDGNASDENGMTGLMHAALGGHDAIVKMLLDKGANTSDRDKVGWTVLHCAAGGGSAEVVSCLLERCDAALLSAKTEAGHTALMLAAFNGHSAVFKMLLDKGADASVVEN
ncbi:unnamed protein product, partial [Ostreobium quekettii]